MIPLWQDTQEITRPMSWSFVTSGGQPFVRMSENTLLGVRFVNVSRSTDNPNTPHSIPMRSLPTLLSTFLSTLLVHYHLLKATTQSVLSPVSFRRTLFT